MRSSSFCSTYCVSKLTVLELLLKIARHVSVEIILERLLPYMLFLVNDSLPQVRAQALKILIHCLQLVCSVPLSVPTYFQSTSLRYCYFFKGTACGWILSFNIEVRGQVLITIYLNCRASVIMHFCFQQIMRYFLENYAPKIPNYVQIMFHGVIACKCSFSYNTSHTKLSKVIKRTRKVFCCEINRSRALFSFPSCDWFYFFQSWCMLYGKSRA